MSATVEGGAAAAAVAAQSAALVEAIAARTPGWDEARGAVAQAARLRTRAADLGAENVRAHRAAVDALGARGGPGLGTRLLAAAEVALVIVETAADVADLAAEVAAHADADVRPDAVVAASLAAGAASAAAHLVGVNLAIGEHDQRRVALAAGLARARDAVERAAAIAT